MNAKEKYQFYYREVRKERNTWSGTARTRMTLRQYIDRGHLWETSIGKAAVESFFSR